MNAKADLYFKSAVKIKPDWYFITCKSFCAPVEWWRQCVGRIRTLHLKIEIFIFVSSSEYKNAIEMSGDPNLYLLTYH